MSDDMKLPDGKTCNDCAFYRWCCALIGTEDITGNAHCDWSPSRFRESTFKRVQP